MGGLPETVGLPQKYRDTAVSSAQIPGLRMAGVDMLESNVGPQGNEVSLSPDLDGVEKCTSLEIAGAIVEDIAARDYRLFFGKRDARHRLLAPKFQRCRHPKIKTLSSTWLFKCS